MLTSTRGGGQATAGLRWEATGVSADLFPVLDADLTLSPMGPASTRLALVGVYRPVFGGLDGNLYPAAVDRVADLTVRALLRSVAGYLTGFRGDLPARAHPPPGQGLLTAVPAPPLVVPLAKPRLLASSADAYRDTRRQAARGISPHGAGQAGQRPRHPDGLTGLAVRAQGGRDGRANSGRGGGQRGRIHARGHPTGHESRPDQQH